MIWKLSIALLCVVCQVKPQDECDVGEVCIHEYRYGTCQLVANCRADGRKWWKYKIRGYEGYEPKVCCLPLPAPATTTTTPLPPPATTPRPSYRRTTTEYTPKTYDYVTIVESENRHGATTKLDEDGCLPLNSDWTIEKNGSKARDKCIEYQKLVYPCESSNALMGGMERGRHCHHVADELIVGGTTAGLYEFPHMVLLGFGWTNSKADWMCGGTLISDRFILTAGHCTSSKSGPVMYAIVGPYRRTDDVSSSQVYRIQRIIKHPGFKALTKTNDIALLETDRTIALDHTVVPACLDVFDESVGRAVATGWGATSYIGSVSDTLQKVTLARFPEWECQRQYPRNRHRVAYDGNTQMCYGDYHGQNDTCQGDSGGPLNIYNSKVKCMYTVVGVTSFGKMCGAVGVPGYYTKVAPYVEWIEKNVWP